MIAITFSNITYDIAKSNGKVCYTLLIILNSGKIRTIYKATMISRNINPMETKSAIPFSQRITNEHLLNRCPFVISFFTFI